MICAFRSSRLSSPIIMSLLATMTAARCARACHVVGDFIHRISMHVLASRVCPIPGDGHVDTLLDRQNRSPVQTSPCLRAVQSKKLRLVRKVAGVDFPAGATSPKLRAASHNPRYLLAAAAVGAEVPPLRVVRPEPPHALGPPQRPAHRF